MRKSQDFELLLPNFIHIYIYIYFLNIFFVENMPKLEKKEKKV